MQKKNLLAYICVLLLYIVYLVSNNSTSTSMNKSEHLTKNLELTPEVVKAISIIWPYAKYIAMDADGSAHLYEKEPELHEGAEIFRIDGEYEAIAILNNYMNTDSWKKSKINIAEYLRIIEYLNCKNA